MITDEDKKAVLAIARKYHASRVILFGSALVHADESRDIDLGVEGIADRDFFAFYGELLCTLSKPVDVVDISKKSRFTELVNKEGVLLWKNRR
ncbi:MAG: nucleotidyltransferase family protein [Desulfococcaceae bacterium]